jgi:uncharacterized membrane protein YsdA (DUF1294 family)
MSDEVITCADCGRLFIWTYAEQRFYKERKLSAPKRCPECRNLRRYEQAQGTAPSGSQALRDWTPPAAPQPAAAQRPPHPSAPDASPAHPRPTSSWTSAVTRFAVLGFGLAVLVAVVMKSAAPSLDPVVCWLLGITAASFFAYGYDKVIAGSDAMRVPERVLHALMFAGGTVGALLAMRYFHHKTVKAEFQSRFWLLLSVQFVLLLLWFVWLRPFLQRF